MGTLDESDPGKASTCAEVDVEQIGKFFCALLDGRLSPSAAEYVDQAAAEIIAGVDLKRMGMLFALASRHARDRVLLDPSEEELTLAAQLVPGWNPERWGLLETLRARLWFARQDLDQASCVEAVEAHFAHADEGECRALYRILPLLPDGLRFQWRMQEGCRTNIVTVFEAVACDNPYPARHFEDVGWRQMAIKALFLGSPLWRVHGLDGRLDEELARMALDLVEERSSAGRPIPADLWLCVGPFEQSRALPMIAHEVDHGTEEGRCAGILALGRALQEGRLEALIRAQDPLLSPWAQAAQDGDCSQAAFSRLPGREAPNQ